MNINRIVICRPKEHSLAGTVVCQNETVLSDRMKQQKQLPVAMKQSESYVTREQQESLSVTCKNRNHHLYQRNNWNHHFYQGTRDHYLLAREERGNHL